MKRIDDLDDSLLFEVTSVEYTVSRFDEGYIVGSQLIMGEKIRDRLIKHKTIVSIKVRKRDK